MAYDKVVDSAQLEAAITTTANAIREKTGDAALIPWLQDKGFAEAIAAIEAGGGKVKTITQVFAEDTSLQWLNFEHNAGFVPNIAVVMRIDTTGTSSYEVLSLIQLFGRGDIKNCITVCTLSRGTEYTVGLKHVDEENFRPNTETTTKLYFHSSSISCKAGVQYLFIFAQEEL